MRSTPRSRAALAGLLLALIPLGLLAIGLAARDALPGPNQRLGGLPPFHWVKAATLTMPRDDFGIAVVNGRIYVLGGMTGERANLLDSVEMYDPATEQWRPGPPMPGARSSFRVAALGQVIYVVGGSMVSRPTTSDVEALDTETGRWTVRAQMPTPRLGHAVVELAGRIYAIGGFESGRGLAAVEVYDPAGDRWTTGRPLPTPRYNLAAVALGGRIYALGGWVADGPSRVVEIYDPMTDSWTRGPALGAPLSNFGAAILGGRIHALHHTTHQVFDPAVNRWLATTPMPTTRHGHGVVTVGDRLYAIGGCYEEPQVDLDVTEVLVPGPAPARVVLPDARSRLAVLALLLGIVGSLMLPAIATAAARRSRHQRTE